MTQPELSRSVPGLLALFLIMPGSGWAQGAGDGEGRLHHRIVQLRMERTFVPVSLFVPLPAAPERDLLWKEACSEAVVLQLAPVAVAGLLQARHPFISLSIPSALAPLVLDLERVDPTAAELTVRTASGEVNIGPAPGVHYRGIVRGRSGSMAAISVFGNEVMGLWNDGADDVILGPFERAEPGLHVLYRESQLRWRPTFSCGVTDQDGPYTVEEITGDPDERSMRCVAFYWEANHNIFLNKGSVTNTVTYLTGLFNQSATLFYNDGIDVILNEIFVWDVPSPYTGTTSSVLLNQFGTYRTSFNGDLAHLLSFQSTGGIAWLNTLCSSTSYRMAYSGIHSTFNNVPTYSWSVEVVSHEQGHNMGSPHTHACAWNGNGTAIDGCGPAAGYTEGGCAAGPVPSSAVGGTVMSYCHLVSAGINFANGFGPQPAALMRNRVNASTCLAMCGTTCDAPGNLSVQSLTPTSVTLTWANVGAQSYTLRWKAVSSGTWNTVPGIVGTSHPLTGLLQEVAYEFQVLSVCPAASSPYSSVHGFTTPAPCPDALEPNNNLVSAPTVTLPASIVATIASGSDVDHYKFILSSTTTLSISLGSLPADYDVRLLNSAGSQLAISQNGGTTAEYISYPNASAGTYYVHVFGYAGAFSDLQCYYLYIGSTGTGCPMPGGLDATGITWSEATLSWISVPAATAFDLQWRIVGAPAWTTVSALTTNTHLLTGLDAATDHEFRVRSVCTGGTQGTTSAYSPAYPFTTLPVPCEISPPVQLSARVLLEGPWKGAVQLMADSLRQLGLVPLGEPYTALGHVLTGTGSTTPAVLVVAGPDAIVDWVVLELRSSTSPATVLEARAVLLQRDGDLVGTDGASPVGFCQPAGSYHVAVRHRNHLGVMSALPITLGAVPTVFDLTVAVTDAYGANARKTADGRMLLWAGNVLADTQVRYSGSFNDRDPILAAIGGAVATNSIIGYHSTDVNLDGRVKYTGPGNDRDVILANIGGAVATGILPEQLP